MVVHRVRGNWDGAAVTAIESVDVGVAVGRQGGGRLYLVWRDTLPDVEQPVSFKLRPPLRPTKP